MAAPASAPPPAQLELDPGLRFAPLRLVHPGAEIRAGHRHLVRRHVPAARIGDSRTSSHPLCVPPVRLTYTRARPDDRFRRRSAVADASYNRAPGTEGVVRSSVFGREAELDEVERFLDATEQSQIRNVALVLEGQPGIGKSAIWREAISRADERGIRILSIRPSEAEARLSYSGLADLLGPAYDEVRERSPSASAGGSRCSACCARSRGDGRIHEPRAQAWSACCTHS